MKKPLHWTNKKGEIVPLRTRHIPPGLQALFDVVKPRLCMTPPDGWRGMKCDCDQRPHICPACQAWAANGFQADEGATAAKITAEQPTITLPNVANLGQIIRIIPKPGSKNLKIHSSGWRRKKIFVIVRPDYMLFWCWSKWDKELAGAAHFSSRAQAKAVKKELEEELAKWNDIPADFLIIRPILEFFPKKPPVSDL